MIAAWSRMVPLALPAAMISSRVSIVTFPALVGTRFSVTRFGSFSLFSALKKVLQTQENLKNLEPEYGILVSLTYKQ